MQNIESTYINRNQFSETLLYAINLEAIMNEGCAVISLNAKFGMGKTFFLQKFQEDLKKNEFEYFSIDAWKSDFYNSPIIAILAEFIAYFDTKNQEIFEKIKNICNIIIKCQTGIDLKESLTNKNDLFEEYKNITKSTKEIKEIIAKYVAELTKPFVILIDELDRTRPTYAVEFLEALKHFFDIKNIVFILAINKDQLKQSTKCLYGDIDFDEYYRKFATYNISLPRINNQESLNYISNKTQEILKLITIKNSKFNIEIEKSILFLIEYFDFFSFRQINEYLRFLAYFFQTKHTNTVDINIICIVILLHLKDHNITEKISKQQYFFTDFAKLFDINKCDKKDYEILYSIFYNMLMFLLENEKDLDSFIEIASKIGINDIKKSDLNQYEHIKIARRTRLKQMACDILGFENW